MPDLAGGRGREESEEKPDRLDHKVQKAPQGPRGSKEFKGFKGLPAPKGSGASRERQAPPAREVRKDRQGQWEKKGIPGLLGPR